MAHSKQPEPSAEALAAAAREGDARAFEALLGRSEGRVLRVLRLLGVPPQDREDVAQEVFLRVFRHLDGFLPGRAYGGWLYRVAVNAAHDYRLRRRRLRRGEVTLTAEPEREVGEGGPRPDEEAAQRDLRRRLEAALGLLTERERAVFVLRELEGLETREVARALGITSITVRRHLGLARKRLRTVLSEGSEKKSAGD